MFLKKITLLIIILLCIITTAVYAGDTEPRDNVFVYQANSEIILSENNEYKIEEGTILPVEVETQEDGTQNYNIKYINIISEDYGIKEISFSDNEIASPDLWEMQDLNVKVMESFKYDSSFIAGEIYGYVDKNQKIQVPILFEGTISADSVELIEPQDTSDTTANLESMTEAVSESEEPSNENDAAVKKVELKIDFEKLAIHLYIIIFLITIIWLAASYRRGSTRIENAIKDKKNDAINKVQIDETLLNKSTETDELRKRVLALEEKVFTKDEEDKKEDIIAEEVLQKPLKHTIYTDFSKLDKEKIMIKFSGGINALNEKMYVTDTESDIIVVENEFTRINAMTVRDNYLNYFYKEIQFPSNGGSNSSYEFIVQQKPKLDKEKDYYIVLKKGIIELKK